jgi:hypothetical protein
MLLGCATNCLPAALPARLALVVAAYSAEDKDLIAASGKYRSPVFDEGFPDLVRHFWSPQFLREVCGAFNLLSLLFQAIQHLSLRLLLRHKCIALLRQLNSLLCVQSR